MIRIVYRTGEEDRVSPKFLDILLYLGQVQLFERAEGWVVVGTDRLRATNSSLHSGTNLRQHNQTPLPAPIQSNFWPPNRLYYQ